MKAAIQASVLQTSSTVSVGAGAEVEVRLPSGALATLYTTREGTTTTVNPIIADATGFFRAYADPGRYNLTVTVGAAVKEYQNVVVLSDVIMEQPPACVGYAWTRVSDNQISSVLTNDFTSLFFVGRRLKINDGGVTKYAVISGSTFTTNTDLTLTMESGAVIAANPVEVCLSSSTTSWVPVSDSGFGGTQINDITSGVIGAVIWWVAVGNDGKISTSTDGGITWTARTSGTTTHLISVAYNPVAETFLIGGYAGLILRSDDGATWANPGDLSSLITDGSGRVNVAYWPQSNTWYSTVDRGVTDWIHKYATDAASMSWLGSGGGTLSAASMAIGINPSDDNSWTASGVTVQEFNSHNDTTVTTLITSLPATATAIDYIYHSASAQYAFVVGLANGHIRFYSDAGALLNTDDVTMTGSTINGSAYSDMLRTIVAVGSGGKVAYNIATTDLLTPDGFTLATTGFNPLSAVTAVHRNEADGVFIACADDGIICRSNNGIN